ncbi:MAG TPA: mechanosensitive ion channel family protein [Candidatus Dormibacteraeota bacterium]|nr:mechanosensitive ion channel family protein [Candidatus Dormibacteraeota bacterium]
MWIHSNLWPSWLSLNFPEFAHGIRIAIILAGAYLLNRALRALFAKSQQRIAQRMAELRGGMDPELKKRATTLGAIARKTIGVIIWIIALIMALREAGFDVTPILAGAGVAGVAVGFGAQHLVRDVIAGAFLLLENQIRVNDVAVINGTGGLVEQINLRTTVLRGMDGTVYIFPNGSIQTLGNMTHGFSYYVFDLGVAYKEDTDRVSEVLKGIADELMKEEKFTKLILAPLEILGVDKFADSAVIIKARIKTVPIQQWMVGREMNRRIKKKFDELGIEIPFPHMSLYFGEASKPFRMSLDQLDRGELKALIREVIEEQQAAQAGKRLGEA